MKQNILNSIGIITIIILFTASNAVISTLLVNSSSDFGNGVIAFISYSASAILTIIYTISIKHACLLSVPSMRPEIKKVNPRLILLGFVMTLAMSIVLGPLVEIMPEEYLDVLDKYMNNGLWAMVVAVISAPIFEEFMFRGVIQTNLVQRYGAIIGIILGAFIFGLMHIAVPQQMVYATGVGLILGSIYYITESLNTVIVLHFLNNGFTYLLFMLFSNTHQLEDVLLSDETTYIITYTTSLILLVLGAGYVIKQAQKEKKAKLLTKLQKK